MRDGIQVYLIREISEALTVCPIVTNVTVRLSVHEMGAGVLTGGSRKEEFKKNVKVKEQY